jgi:hypothetical protein
LGDLGRDACRWVFAYTALMTAMRTRSIAAITPFRYSHQPMQLAKVLAVLEPLKFLRTQARRGPRVLESR